MNISFYDTETHQNRHTTVQRQAHIKIGTGRSKRVIFHRSNQITQIRIQYAQNHVQKFKELTETKEYKNIIK